MAAVKNKLVTLFLFVFINLNGTSGQKKFRNDYSYFDEVDGWYKMHKFPAQWKDARLRCHLEGAVLASPIDRSQDQAMNIIMLRYGIKEGIFTGIHATFSMGDFFSVDGIPLSSIPQKWAPNEPSNKNNTDSCIQQNSDGSLSAVSCYVTRPYMCFKKYTRPLTVNACGTVDPKYEYDARTGKCYKFHSTGRTFSRAFMTCAAEGGHLAIINSEVEAEVLLELIQRYPEESIVGYAKGKPWAFIGFHNWDEVLEWRTIHGETLEDAGFAKWSPGEPNNDRGHNINGENCGCFNRQGMLNDVSCDYTISAICEKSPSNVT